MSADDQLRTDASGVSGVPATVGPKAAADDAAPQTNMSDEGAADSKAARTKTAHGKPSKGETARAQDAAAGTRRPQRGTRRKKTGKIDNKPLKTVSADESSRVGDPDRDHTRKKEKSQRVGAVSAARVTPHAKNKGSGSDTVHSTAASRTIFARLAGLRKGKSPSGQEPQRTPRPGVSPAAAPKQEGNSTHAATKRARLPLPLRHRSDSGEDRTKGRRTDRESTPVPTLSIGERCVATKDWLLCHPGLCAAAAILLVAAVALYSPVRNYYVAIRTGQVLQVKYDQLSDENAGLTYDVNRLQTKQGIEDEARKRGYVSTDEIGKDPDLPDPPSIAEAQSATMQKDPSTPRVYPDDRSWHVKALDRLFFYDPEVTWNG